MNTKDSGQRCLFEQSMVRMYVVQMVYRTHTLLEYEIYSLAQRAVVVDCP